MTAARVFRVSERDALVFGAALAHAALLAAALAFAALGAPGPLASAALVIGLALAMNWSSNTVSHIHLHAPLFRGQAANAAFSIFLSVLLAVPQSWWKLRHLHHHGLQDAATRTLRARGALELALLLAFVASFAAIAPLAFATVYAPAMLLGFGLCANQGRQEHLRSPDGVDVHAPAYNRLWFNDGFHAAHHRAPEAHWTTLPAHAVANDVVSTLPPIVRWVEELPVFANRFAAAVIDALERATLRRPLIRRYLLATHERAWTRVLAGTGDIRRVTIIGGGLFPRTALVLSRLLPNARLTLVDTVPAHLDHARAFLGPVTRQRPDSIRLVAGTFDPAAPEHAADLVVVPLAFRGDRDRFYQAPPAPLVAVHDWLWRRRSTTGTRISFLLLKRLNLIRLPLPAPAGRGSG